jgi:uncharacterized protein
LVAETALAQARAIDPAWEPPQRDCAGLVRFAYRTAYRTLDPERLRRPLWTDGEGRPADFADAEALLRGSFSPLGRDDAARAELRSGDLLAFRRPSEDGPPVYHLMLVVRGAGPALVVYHTGSPQGSVRFGRLDRLAAEAPAEWQPDPGNPAFLGYYRFKEWMP